MNQFQVAQYKDLGNGQKILSICETFATFEEAERKYELMAEGVQPGMTITFRIWDGKVWTEPAINMETTITA